MNKTKQIIAAASLASFVLVGGCATKAGTGGLMGAGAGGATGAGIGAAVDVNESDLKAAAKSNITELAKVLERYDDTDIVVAGHTDSSGKPEYNKELSGRRAEAVAKYAEAQGIKGVRIRTVGEGEATPVAENDSEDGRAKNRRVEVAIFANDRMKKAVEKEGR